MVLEAVQAVIGLLMVFFLPGFTFIRMLFPRNEELDPEYGLLYQIALGMAMSIVMVILVGISLSSLGVDPTTGRGYFDAANLWVSLGILTAIFFVAGWFRGGYPFLRAIHPALGREPGVPLARKVRRSDLARFRELSEERNALLSQLRDAERRIIHARKDLRTYYEKKKKETLKAIERVDEALVALREDANLSEVENDADPADRKGE